MTLLNIDVPADFWDTQSGGVEVRLDNYSPGAASDFDLYIYKYDPSNTEDPIGNLVASSGAVPSQPERTSFQEPRGLYLVEVVYYAVVSSSYDAHVEFFFRDRTPPDVDTPPGLQEIIASNANAGWTSRSEPHIAQSPLNPNILVAGSKFYNKDPDALQEYEFKIGTFVSFDGGRSWTDLGQLKTCAPGDAPPSSWPDENPCYPADDPARDGTGAEDIRLAPGVRVDVVPAGAPVAEGSQMQGVEFEASKPLEDGAVGSLPVFFANDQFGCDWSNVPAGTTEWIALAKRGAGGACLQGAFQEKLTAATAAGADAAIIVNNVDELPAADARPLGVTPVPAIVVKQSDGDSLISGVQAGDVRATMDILDFATPRGGGGDFAEEYITSDIWLQFDDEGNAYAMVLDAPPFESGVGWGMTLHRWESVSQADLVNGNTWSDRIPINAYPEDFARDFLGFLDDKNTFAVNNAGPDSDGKTGIMIACWGQNVSELIKQEIVCERSIDSGKTWPDQPVAISDGDQLVIGVHVIADEADPNTFYAVWLQYETTLATGLGTVEYAKTTNGGQTWLPATAVGVIDDIPRTFPHQAFRNLSIPVMAVGPDPDGVSGSAAPPLYVVVSEYLEAPAASKANDEDGLQADVVMFKSTNGGVSWSKSNDTNGLGPNPNADQFQPYIDVTELGQVNVFFFDRSLDVKTTSHPGNYFVDPYLSRSNNGGDTWTHIRLSHDATDPEFNAPVSGSGLFFGDYQGLVANECFAIPFVNDTHLANDEYLDSGPVRDADFDTGLRSFQDAQYQQAVTWRVPNSQAFGGSGTSCPADLAVDKTGPAGAKRGASFTYSMVVTNNGPGDANGVTLNDNLPKNSGYGKFTTTQGSCILKPEKRLLTCNLGALGTTKTATVTITVKPNSKGTITNTASVTAATPDNKSANNQDSVVTTVAP